MTESSGLKLGRYELKGKLSADEVSVLYGALDLHSGRRVALRIIQLPSTVDPAARQELLRRARALTTLRHPNVTPVYEVGEDGLEIYLAEELLYGPTLEQWLLERRRGWRDICRTYMQAGSGLLALHAAGLGAHGFLPSDVVVTKERRVVLSDAMVLRSLASGNPDSPDPRADQQAFAAALFSALVGAPPPSDPSLVVSAIAEHRLPRGIAPVLERALSLEPDKRYSTLREALSALAGPVESAGYSPRLVLAIASAAILAMFLGMVLGASSGGTPLPSTSDVRERLCEGRDVSFGKVWNAEAKKKAHWTMWKAETPLVGSSWLVVQRALDSWIDDWEIAFHHYCGSDLPVRTEELQSALSCLLSERDRAMAFLGVLPEIGAERTVAALRGLRSPGSCGAMDQKTVAWVDRVLARKVELVVGSTTATTAYAADDADADGFLAWAEGELDVAGRHFERAAMIFEGRRQDLELADTLNNLALLRHQQGRLEEAVPLLRRAAKLREASAGAEDAVLADYLLSLGLMVGEQGALSEGLVLERRGLSIRERTLSADAPEVAESYRAIGWLEHASARYAEAQDSYRRALGMRIATFGEDSGEVTQVRIELGWVLLAMNKVGEALEIFERARLVAQHAGRRSLLMAAALAGEGATRLARGDAGDAVGVLEEALKIRESAHSNRRSIAEVQVLLARALIQSGGDKDRASRLLGSAGATYSEVGASASPEAEIVSKMLADLSKPEGSKR